MHTLEDYPWLPYLDIDEETDERFLKDDAPVDVKERYAEHLSQIAKITERGELISK